MLIADDVGIGKTVEALLIARELLDRAEIQRFSVLCPPHLAEQWQEELREKFHIEAELVLSGTAKRLDRICGKSLRVRRLSVHNRFHGLHQVRLPPRRLHPCLSGNGHCRRSSYVCCSWAKGQI